MIHITVSSELNVKEGLLSTLMRTKNRKIMSRVRKGIIHDLRHECPVRTGRMRRSIRTINSVEYDSSGGFAGFLTVGPTVYYAKYVIEGTSRITQNDFIAAARPAIAKGIKLILAEQYGGNNFNVAQLLSDRTH